MSVAEAGSGEDALALVDSGTPFDIAVLDMKMPGMSGVELAFLLRSPPSPAVFPHLLLSSRGDRPTGQPQLFAAVLSTPARSAGFEGASPTR